MAANWTSVPDGDVDPESPITTSLMQALRDNPEGLAGGVAGAPRVQTAAIADDAVTAAKIAAGEVGQSEVANSAIGQGELKTTSGAVSFNDGGSGQTIRTLPGGQYGFNWESSFSESGGSSHSGFAIQMEGDSLSFTAGAGPEAMTLLSHDDGASGTGYAQRIFMYAQANGTINARQRYVQSSPPYDMGDGECGLFVEVDMRPDGSIAGVFVAPDPIWANNGPTDIKPTRIDKKTGRWYKAIRRPALTWDDLIAGRCDMADYVAAQKEAPVEEIEVTSEFKRSDMEIVPHSWDSAPQGTICLLDPVETFDLLALHEAGEDVVDLIHKGYIQIGDECKRCGPPGVVPVTWNWSNKR